ncbi:MAG: hypothetical protein MJ154_03015 [Candidatus Saccharibacteria bacterium]|nr:hypothetical protein [Candidatus Saccharibacteria bacterium]
MKKVFLTLFIFLSLAAVTANMAVTVDAGREAQINQAAVAQNKKKAKNPVQEEQLVETQAVQEQPKPVATTPVQKPAVQTQVTQKPKTTPTPARAPQNILTVPGIGKAINGANNTDLSKLNTQLNRVNSNLLSRFTSSGWSVYVTGENIAQTHFGGKYSSVQGVTDYNHRAIYIEKRDVAIRESTIHEFGHFLDYSNRFISNKAEFMAIYNEEVAQFKRNISNPGCVRDPQEFFAETFYYMHVNPSKCTPKAKAFISKLY